LCRDDRCDIRPHRRTPRALASAAPTAVRARADSRPASRCDARLARARLRRRIINHAYAATRSQAATVAASFWSSGPRTPQPVRRRPAEAVPPQSAATRRESARASRSTISIRRIACGTHGRVRPDASPPHARSSSSEHRGKDHRSVVRELSQG
jgi:hypothetical protein